MNRTRLAVLLLASMHLLATIALADDRSEEARLAELLAEYRKAGSSEEKRRIHAEIQALRDRLRAARKDGGAGAKKDGATGTESGTESGADSGPEPIPGGGSPLDTIPARDLQARVTFHPGALPWARGERPAVGRALEEIAGFLSGQRIVFQRAKEDGFGSPAVFDHETGVIRLYDAFFDLGPTARQRVLAHELVHQLHHDHPEAFQDFFAIGWTNPGRIRDTNEAARQPGRWPAAAGATFPARNDGDTHAASSPLEDLGVSLEMYLYDRENLAAQSPERAAWFDAFLERLVQR